MWAAVQLKSIVYKEHTIMEQRQAGCCHQHYLQTPVVVEDCCWCAAVFKLIKIRLQVASVKHFAKNKAACKVLQEQHMVQCRPSPRCETLH